METLGGQVDIEYGHEFIHDYETLAILLKRAGFARVERQLYRQGRDSSLLIELGT